MHSAPIEIPRHDAVLWVTLSPGTQAARGGPPLARELTEKVVVPGLYNFLKITSAQINLVDNERYEPEQALIVETSVGTADKEIAKALRATLLPEKTGPRRACLVRRSGAGDAGGPEARDRRSRSRPSPARPSSRRPTRSSSRLRSGGRSTFKSAKGLHAFGGYLLGETYQTIVSVPPYPHMLRILQNGALLAQSGEHKVPVLARDIPAIKYEIGRVLPGQIQHLVTQSLGDFARPTWNYRFDETNLAEIFEETHTLGRRARQARVRRARSVEVPDRRRRRRPAMTGAGCSCSARRASIPRPTRCSTRPTRGWCWSPTSACWSRRTPTASHDVFVQSIRTGEPVAGARVEVLGKNGVAVVDAITDTRRPRQPARRSRTCSARRSRRCTW